jgi:Cu/Ag efflux protein CusF
MYECKSHRERLIVLVPLALLLLFVVACGSSSTGSSSSTAAAATPTCPPNRFKTATGTVQSFSSNALVVKNAQGTDVQASYTKTTRFQQETQATTSALKEGLSVSVAAAQGGSFYTATRVMLLGNRATGTGRGTFGGTGTPGTGRTRNASCFRRGLGANAAAAGSTNSTNITGTISQLSSSTLTVTDVQGATYTLTLNGSTKIFQYKTATAKELKTGAPITVTGTDNGQGGITAQSVTVLLASSAA